MTDTKLSPLQQSLIDDIAAEQAALNPPAEEKGAEEIANAVKNKLDEVDHTVLEKDSPILDEEPPVKAEERALNEDDEIPANPTNDDFAKLRKAKTDAEREAQRLREDLARKQGYIQAKQEQPAAVKAAPQDIEPEFDTDPKAWVQWNDRQHKKEIEGLKSTFQSVQVRSQLKEVIDLAKADETNYATSNPDYAPAKKFLDDIVMNNLRAQYPDKSDAEIKVQALQDEYATILVARNNGIKPALYFEMLAKQAGYTTQAKAPEIKQPEVKAPLEKSPNMDAIKRNKAKTPTLVGTRSNAGGLGEPTDEEVADMTLQQMAAMR